MSTCGRDRRYCEAQTQGHPDQSLLLWRGIEMVEILSMLSMDIESLCAALIFPLANDEVVSEEELETAVGKGIVSLVHGVRDMDAIRQLKAIHNDSMASEQVDNVRRMLLAMVEDFRCVVLKLAERIMNLREMKDAPEDERVLAAKESTNIYAPLANRLGIGQLKWELEDYCFRYLHPDEYKRIAKLLHERRIDREQYIENFVSNLRKEMVKEGVRAEVYGRPKHIYSIWRKMQKNRWPLMSCLTCGRCASSPIACRIATVRWVRCIRSIAICPASLMTTSLTPNPTATSRFIRWC